MSELDELVRALIDALIAYPVALAETRTRQRVLSTFTDCIINDTFKLGCSARVKRMDPVRCAANAHATPRYLVPLTAAALECGSLLFCCTMPSGDFAKGLLAGVAISSLLFMCVVLCNHVRHCARAERSLVFALIHCHY